MRPVQLKLKALCAAAVLAPFIAAWLWVIILLVGDLPSAQASVGPFDTALSVAWGFLGSFPLAALAVLFGFLPAMVLLSIPIAIASMWGTKRSYTGAGLAASLAFIGIGWWIHQAEPDLSWMGWFIFVWLPFALRDVSAIAFTLGSIIAGLSAGRVYAAAAGAHQ